ncbi:AGR252Cp [Eremothecium gossypii ATCC 10895]|uniref:AGR252Cp n=1 Tax=Eremothecium gossypii (strain ATCC 10895 / CBS 109.51 / FGSC 9923 / NRRL Y-1056) TaxID=284811 RepID=Q74ZE7_EREGS|nr:AGR252Cp [Eremothecium gossypii ATCC 10895]AAS54742.1 AGR252Cp [Eremothecium gossypii ATCC 10895]
MTCRLQDSQAVKHVCPVRNSQIQYSSTHMTAKVSSTSHASKKRKVLKNVHEHDAVPSTSTPPSEGVAETAASGSEESAVEESAGSASGTEEESSDDDLPAKKRASMPKHSDGAEGFSSALTNILSSHLKAYDRSNPILARNKKVLRQNEADKLELKAKKALLAEKKQRLAKTRKRDILPVAAADDDAELIRATLEKERRLRKVAQKGVVKLFNAILATQVKTEREARETSLKDVKNQAERRELITEVSKEKFLDLVKAAGDA